jgi:hypothetical protein
MVGMIDNTACVSVFNIYTNLKFEFIRHDCVPCLDLMLCCEADACPKLLEMIAGIWGKVMG